MINAQTKLCLIIGDPVNHSLSPVMHNTAYQKIGLGDQFVFLASRVKPQQLKSARFKLHHTS
jgi:shikimate dehydrogenase